MVELSITIPFYNEETNVANAVGEIAGVLGRKGVDYELVCIDNGSTDKTQELIKKQAGKNPRVRLLVIEENKGYGYGVRQGLAACRGRYLGWGWGDLQIRADMFYEVYKALKEQRLDLAKIRRVVRNDGLARKVQSFGYNNLFCTVFGFYVADVNGCPKILTRKFYETAKLSANDWFIDAEILLHARNTNAKFVELPAEFLKRPSGISNYSIDNIREYSTNVFSYKLSGKDREI